MSEAELHFIRAWLRGGPLSKARRGDLKMGLPIGLVYDLSDKIVLDPDARVRDAISHLFAALARTGSARAVVQEFARDGLLFPVRVRKGAHKAELTWAPAEPLAGAAHPAQRPLCRCVRLRPAPRGTHPGYLSCEQFEINQQLLAANAQAHDKERDRGPAREGPALLQGLATCGRCERRMTVRYNVRRGVQIPDYQCMRASIDTGGPRCQAFPGGAVDVAIGRLLLDTVTPLTPRRCPVRVGRTRDPRRRSRCAAPLARRPGQRTCRPGPPPLPRRRPRQPARRRQTRSGLERRASRAARRRGRLRQGRGAGAETLNEQNKARIRGLATDFPALWSNPAISSRPPHATSSTPP
ncbi:MAG: zinc ribbon domain-containing protein [Nocardioidaceae bacterium]